MEVSKGGVTYKDSEDNWWYEEYADIGGKETRVLNGMLFALIGIYEYYQTTHDRLAKELFDKGFTSVKKHLQDFDAGWWTYYDSLNLLANRKYHAIHVELLKQLYEITADREVLNYYKKWKKYKVPFFIREFLRQRPDERDILILMVNILGIWLLFEIGLVTAKKIKGNI